MLFYFFDNLEIKISYFVQTFLKPNLKNTNFLLKDVAADDNISVLLRQEHTRRIQIVKFVFNTRYPVSNSRLGLVPLGAG